MRTAARAGEPRRKVDGCRATVAPAAVPEVRAIRPQSPFILRSSAPDRPSPRV
jgi:hypothetical protein